MLIIIAMATALSAAAMAMPKMEKNKPSCVPLKSKRLNTAKFRSALLSMSSMLSNMANVLLRVRNP